MKGTYHRWTRAGNASTPLVADILGDFSIVANPATGLVSAMIPDRAMDPDTCRMVGVRLIEAAVLADAGRSVREP